MRKHLYLLALLSIPTVAQETFHLEEITKKEVSKEKQTKKIYKEEIENHKISDLGKILEKTTSVINSIRKGGTFSDIVLRGFYRDNINVLIDDSKIYGACPNRMDPPISKISSIEIEKVEIKKGSFDIENQGSLAGSVNIKTINPSKDEKFNINLTLASFSYFQGSILLNGGNKKIDVLAAYEKSYSKPYKTGEGKRFTEYKHPNPANDYQKGQINRTAYDIDNILTGLRLKPNKENEFLVKIGYQKAKSVLYPYLKMDTIYDHTYKINFKYNQKTLNIKANLYFNSTYHDMSDKWRNSAIPWTNGTNSTRGYMMRTVAKSKVYGFSIKKDFRLKNLDFKLGTDGYIRNWVADNILMMNDNRGMIPNVYIKNIGVFLKTNKKIDRNLVSAGIRYDISYSKANKDALGSANKNLYDEYYQYNYNLSKTDAYLSGFLKYEHFLNKYTSIFTALGKTVRIPDPQERYIALRKPLTNPDWVGNPNLKPPKNTELDIGLNYKRQNLKFNTTIFYSYINDYIYLTKIQAVKQATSYKNIDAKFFGFDFSTFYTFKDFYFLSLSGAYQIGEKISGKDKDIAEIPPFKLILSVGYDDLEKFTKLSVNHAFKQTKVDSTLNEQKTPSWTTVDIQVGIKYKNIKISTGIDNLFNQTYYTHLSYLRDPFSTGMKVPEAGRFLYLSVSGNF